MGTPEEGPPCLVQASPLITGRHAAAHNGNAVRRRRDVPRWTCGGAADVSVFEGRAGARAVGTREWTQRSGFGDWWQYTLGAVD